MSRLCTHKLAELFCGPGGLALGSKTARVRRNGKTFSIKPVWANDIDKWACETYRRNIHPNKPNAVVEAPIWSAIEVMPKVDGIAFGFPCNDFSVVGEKLGVKGKYGRLYKYGLKAIEKCAPKWFIAENVKGLKSSDNGRTFTRLLAELASCGNGYKLTPHLYKFEEYGVPQNRHRIIIVGIRNDLKLMYKVPAPTITDKPVSAKEAIENPPIISLANHEYKKQTKRVTELLAFIPPDKNLWYDKVPTYFQFKTKTKLSNIYRRLSLAKPSYTVTGSGGGGTYMYHWKENRALTNRERARLQTFPDDFVFYGPYGNVRKQIGMAVPPKAAKIVFEALLKTFAGIKYKSVKQNIDSQNKKSYTKENG